MKTPSWNFCFFRYWVAKFLTADYVIKMLAVVMPPLKTVVKT